MSKTAIIIPARFKSSRFPGKPLAKISGKTMIERVYNRAIKAEILDELFVVTDDERIESECKKKSSSEEIAKKTLDCLKKNVPSEVPSIAFLSGGQSEIEASKNLNEINKLNDTKFLITFSYGRGLQASALKEFGKNQNNIENIQKAFDHRAKMNGLSSKGEWSENLEKEFAA